MRSRAVRTLAAAAVLAALALGVACFVLALNAESTAERVADGALVLVLLVVAIPVTFLAWPRRA